MIALPFLLFVGPCLIMALAALALGVVNVGLSRTGHALVWAMACGSGALHWGVLALQGAFDLRLLHGGVVASMIRLGMNALFAEGFRMRRWPRRGRTSLLAAVALGMLALIATAWMPKLPIRTAVSPLLSCGLLLWSAGMVVRRDRLPSATEATVAIILAALATMHLCAATLAIAEQFGILPDHRAFRMVYLFTALPASAAIALAALIMIAHDYAAELQRLLHTDPLTGILNRQGFDHLAQPAFARARRVALALADIDHFKEVNDRHGHAAGDAALAGIAERLASGLGRDGTVARIGGEEFAILLPGLDGAAALGRIDLLRRGLGAGTTENPALPPTTVSFGVAERAPGETLADVMERADAALYRSKREGRDRSTLAPAGPGGA